MYKLEVYLPSIAFDKVYELIQKYDVGKIGNYSHCMSWYKVNSSWFSNTNANPFNGEKNKTTISEEIKIELLTSRRNALSLLKEIKKVHPYESICYFLIKLK